MRIWLAFLFSIVFLTIGIAGCGHRARVPQVSPTVAIGHPVLAFESALYVVRSAGYNILEYDGERGFIRVVARLEANTASVGWGYQVSRRDSYFSLQIFPDGTLRAIASGYHVRDGKMDERLVNELNWLVDSIVEESIRRRSLPQGPVQPPGPQQPPQPPASTRPALDPSPATSV